MTEPHFFEDATAWRAWLEEHHATAAERVLGFYKAGSNRTGLSRQEALDEALCFGWIDGRAQGIDDVSWAMRFTPRRKRSVWSAVNIARVEELLAAERMTPAGLAAYERRDPKLQNRYSGENPDVTLDPAYEARFRENAPAWTWFSARPRSYRHPATWWVMSAVKPETRERRLATLIADSEAGRTLKHLTPRARSTQT